MDFSKLGSTKKARTPVNPIKIFETLPSLSGTFNDLWRGQDKALAEWHTNRDKGDVLVSLNTGAGKTIVGLLIAQSLVNEGLENVLYVCSTIDLVRQTSEEAKRIGMEHTTRVRREFSNDLFETGKSFCVTTYAAVFNGHSAILRRDSTSAAHGCSKSCCAMASRMTTNSNIRSRGWKIILRPARRSSRAACSS